MRGTLLLLALAACATTRPAPAEGERIDTVTVVLDRKVQFFAGPEAAPRIPEPGTYRVEATGQKTLRLVAADGKGTVELPALEGTHKEPIEVPVAFTFQSDEDTQQVVLRLPGGKALHAVGSYSGSRPRADPLDKTAPLAQLVPPPAPPAGSKCVEIAAVDFNVDQYGATWGAIRLSWFGAQSLLRRSSTGSGVEWETLVSGVRALPVGADLRGIDIFWYDSDPYYDVKVSITESYASSTIYMPVTTIANVSSQGSSGYGWSRYVFAGAGFSNYADDKLLTISALLPSTYSSYSTSLRSVRLWYTE